MLLSDLENKKILIWGMGSEGKSVFDYLTSHSIGAEIFIYQDSDGSDKFSELLNKTDVIIRSPGVSIYKDEISNAKKDGVKITSSSDLFLSEMRENHPNTKVIAITGSKGKSMSVSMLYHIMQKAGCKVALGGNIGKALIEMIDEENDYVIAESSSYQASDLTVSPHIAMFTNLFSVHTDWHNGNDNYCKDKIHLVSNQKAGDVCFINARNEKLVDYFSDIANKNFYNIDDVFHAQEKELFYQNECLINIDDLQIMGNHNIENLCGVLMIVKHLGLDIKQALENLKSFAPLEHRLQKVKVTNGVLFINDSISTAPEAAIAAMKSFDDNIAIISGGTINNQDYTDYAKYIQENEKVKLVVTLFQCGPQIAESIKKYVTRNDFKLLEAESLSEAVSFAYNEIKSLGEGKVLFSPTAPSFGFYKNFIERGQDFIDNVNKQGL